MSEVEKLFEEFKGRLVEVECECDDEKRAKCVMYPEYCDGTRKEIIDLVQLIDEGLNNRLLADKDTRIEELEKENAELRKCNGELAGQNASLNRWLGEAITFIKDYMIITIGDHTTVCSVPEENRCINVLKLNERAKSFLKEFE